MAYETFAFIYDDAKSDQTARTADFGGRLAELWDQCVIA